MKTEIQEKFESFHRKETTLRRITILLAFIPFVIGSLWMYYSYQKVQDLEKQYAITKDNSIKEEAKLKGLQSKKQQLELELMKTYGLPIDSIMNLSGNDIVIKNSIRANDAINKLSNNYAPKKNITIRYYYKTIDDEKIIISLKSLGYLFEEKKAAEHMTVQKTNSIWYGSDVSITDCKIVALALMRAGIEIKAIRGFRNNETNPSFKSNIIEIGGDKRLENSNSLGLTVTQVENATAFLRDN